MQPSYGASTRTNKMRIGKACTSLYLVFLMTLLISACSSIPSSKNKLLNANDLSEGLSKDEQIRRDVLLAGKSARPSLKSLILEPVRTEKLDIPTLSLVEKRAEYEALLPLISDPIQKQQMMFRLADIKMMLAEQQQEEGLSNANALVGAFDDVVAHYEQVLSNNSIVVPAPGLVLSQEQQAFNRKQMDAQYQLSRALDLAAKPEQSAEQAKVFLRTFNAQQFGITPYHVELYFRIGEYYFNRQQYADAVTYYNKVVEHGKGGRSAAQQSNFYAISAYMLGWSHFKLDNYADSMQAFATMLDTSLYQLPKIESTPLDQLELSKGELRLVKDSVRIMALTFSYQGNAQAIDDFFNTFGARQFEHLIYQELAQQHLDNDRFQDSANALLAFATKYPTHFRAIEFYIRHIDAFVLGNFADKVLLAKARFVQTYSMGNGVITSLNTPIGRDVEPYLKQFLKQLAQTEHSIAQGIEAILAARKQAANSTLENANSGFVGNTLSQQQSALWKSASIEDLQALSREAYSKAKDYYENYIRTFSSSDELVQLRFYLGEALFALQEYAAAIEVFETYAYVDQANPKAVEAAYAALLSYAELEKSTLAGKAELDTQSRLKYAAPLSLRQKSQARFANTFVSDKRSPMVALSLMQELFAQQNYLSAQEWAAWILAKADASFVSAAMLESARLINAHSHFAMQDFAQAEKAYRLILASLLETDPKHMQINNRLAASLYKQAESLLLQNKLDIASLSAQKITNKSQLSATQISHIEQGLKFLQQVVSETPLSEFRLAAQYDSAMYFSLLDLWSQAITTLVDFKQRYPGHHLSKGIDDQLLYAYQQTEDWGKAAKILVKRYSASPSSDAGRLALYRSAEFFEKAGEKSSALVHYRQYAHEYPMPITEANEARFKLSEYYLAAGRDRKRRFWLNHLVKAQLEIQDKYPQFNSARSVYLASMAAMVFASDADKKFSNIKLTQPLAKSLKQKQSALKKAIYEYDRVMSFGSTDFVAAANYKLANLYLTLADDLMNSSRPKGLSPLELSQYEILLEEQAYPFEETAINLHENNIGRIQNGIYDDWIKQSFARLKDIMPARYNKSELKDEVTANDF